MRCVIYSAEGFYDSYNNHIPPSFLHAILSLSFHNFIAILDLRIMLAHDTMYRNDLLRRG